MTKCKYCGVDSYGKNFCCEEHEHKSIDFLLERIANADDFFEAKAEIVEVLTYLVNKGRKDV